MTGATNPKPLFPSTGLAVLLTVGALGLQVAMGIPVELAGMVYGAIVGDGEVHWSRHALALALINTVALGLVIAWGTYMARSRPSHVFALRRVRPLLLLAVLLSALGAAIVLSEVDNLFRFVFPPPRWLVEHFDDLLAGSPLWSVVLAVVVVAPVTEEVLFRGLILRGLLTHRSAAGAIGVSALLFSLAHVNPWQIGSTMALGLLYGWWYWRSRSLVPSLLGHGLNNAMVVGAAWLPFEVRGFNPQDLPLEVELQPWWFDAVGLGLLALGLALFHRCSPEPLPPSRPSDHLAALPPPPAPPVAGDPRSDGDDVPLTC